MKKVLGAMSKFIFGAFGIAVLILLASLTYGALQKLFPDNFTNQVWGLVMFDIAAMCWAIAFVFQSKSTGQYATSGLGFVVGFVGTLLMVGYEVVSSGQNIAKVDASEWGRWVVYGFIAVTALHAILIYAHHALAPEIAEQINVGIARGEVVTQAITDATKTIESEKHELSRAIYYDIVSQVKKDLGMHPATGTPFEPRRYEQTEPIPEGTKAMYPPGTQFIDGTSNPLPVTWARQEDATATARPLSQRFRDWVNGLRQQPAPSQPQRLHMAQTHDAMRAWQETPAGRVRWWCKTCRNEGKEWLTPTPCTHILEAKPEQIISFEEAEATVEALRSEMSVPNQVPDDPNYWNEHPNPYRQPDPGEGNHA